MLAPLNAADIYAAAVSTFTFDIDELDILTGDIPPNSQLCISSEGSEALTRIGTTIVASHLASNTGDVAILDCSNDFDVRALKNRLAKQTDDVMALLARVKVTRAFDLAEAREGMDKILKTIGTGCQLVVVNGISRLVSTTGVVQGQAILDAILRSVHDVAKSTVLLTDRFVPDNGQDDDECAVESTTRQRPFFSAANAPLLDLHLHVHTMSQGEIVEIATNRFHGNISACTQLMPES